MQEMRLERLERKVLQGGALDWEEACWLMKDVPLEDLCETSGRISRRAASKRFHFCSIINAKSGLCPEDCHWCAQSSRYRTGVRTGNLVSFSECRSLVARNYAQGVRAFSFVTSGRKLPSEEVARLCGYVALLRKEFPMEYCASAGLLEKPDLEKLKEAGFSRYHCNLETAPSFFGTVCSTHTFREKVRTLEDARAAGLELCSGGILGMGENALQRLELAWTLARLEVRSIPLNILQPIPGTPLENAFPFGDEDLLRSIAVFRFLNPAAYLRFAGGRASLDRNLQQRAIRAGINAAITGDMLTTTGSGIVQDKEMIKDSGYDC